MKTRYAFLLIMLAITALHFSCAESDKEFVKIAMCQIICLDGDREGNLVRVESAIREAKEKEARIVCFPEMVLFGWVNPDAHKRAFSIPGEDTRRLGRLAKKYGVYLSAGLAEKEGDRLYDSAVLIDPHGRILLKHRKINILTELMEPPYTPGEEVKVAETEFGNIGILICADSFKEPICRRMAELKPDMVFIPYGWAADEGEWPDHGKSLKRVVQRAAKWMDACVIGTDLVGEITHGPWKGKVYGGQSVSATAKGKVLATARDRQRDIQVITVKLRTRKPIP
jgi:N-carbamoylputrescine amidase